MFYGKLSAGDPVLRSARYGIVFYPVFGTVLFVGSFKMQKGMMPRFYKINSNNI